MNPHILIIEDEREIAELVELSLARAHFTARIAPTAEQAWQLLAREHFDLLLLDIGLPDTDGFELLKTLRPQHPQPVIMLTAQDEETDRILGLELGADDYIGKPFSPRELVARVKAVLRRTQTQPAAEAAPIWHDDAPACCAPCFTAPAACSAAKNCSPPCSAATAPPTRTPSTPTSAPCATNCAQPASPTNTSAPITGWGIVLTKPETRFSDGLSSCRNHPQE